MSWTTYATFVAFAVVVVVAPGPDFAVVLRNTLSRGRGAGLFTSFGVAASCLVQGTLAACGVGVVIAGSQPLFHAIRWVGAAYLGYLGVRTLLTAHRGDASAAAPPAPMERRRPRLSAWRQGFLSNITNPKVLALYLSVLPQFLGRAGTPTIDALALAYTHAVLGLLWLAALVTFIHRMRPWIQRRRVRRAIDTGTGAALVGFASGLAFENR